MYKVLVSFTDDVDGGVYYPNDQYPRSNAKPTEERVAYLLGSSNKFEKPVIEAIKAENNTKGKTKNENSKN